MLPTNASNKYSRIPNARFGYNRIRKILNTCSKYELYDVATSCLIISQKRIILYLFHTFQSSVLVFQRLLLLCSLIQSNSLILLAKLGKVSLKFQNFHKKRLNRNGNLSKLVSKVFTFQKILQDYISLFTKVLKPQTDIGYN